MIPDNAPDWVKRAKTIDADVEIAEDGTVIWHGGTWMDGDWHGGDWRDPHIPDRVAYHAALLGLVFGENGRAVGYRSVSADLTGRHNRNFVQTLGRIDVKHAPAGAGTCRPGLHVTSAAIAWTYFGIDPAARLIRVEFERADLLDCDGEKARLRGGWCTEIPWPWSQGVSAAQPQID